MKNCTLTVLLLVLGICGSAAAQKSTVVWKESFSKDGSLTGNGYHQTLNNGKDQFTVSGGILNMVCQNSPYKGSHFRKEIPGPESGELTFEAYVGGGTEYNHHSLKLLIGKLFVSWRNGGMMALYHGKTNKWNILSYGVHSATWNKYKIRFNAKAKTAEFYINDMENPVYIDESSEYVPGEKVFFELANYGLCSGTVINKIRNIELKSIPVSDTGSSELKGVMVFRGVTESYWGLDEFIKKLGKKDVSEFYIQYTPHHATNKPPVFRLQTKPSPGKIPEFTILADMPSTAIPNYVFQMIRKSVENGGKLIILGGYYSLQRGEYQNTILKELIPVVFDGNFWKEPAPAPDAQILKPDGKYPIYKRAFGKGTVYVVPGNAVKNPDLKNILNLYSF